LRSRNLTWVAAGALVLVALAAGVHYSGNAANSSAAAAASSAAEDLATLALPLTASGTPSVAPSVASFGALGGHGAAPLSLAAEIAAIRPLISDTNGPLDRGTASLALWASTSLGWSDLKTLPSTSPALFRKDPEQERGRSLCIEGIIQEIRAEKNLSRRLITDRASPLVDPTGSALGSRALGGSATGSQPGAGDSNRADAGDAPRLLGGNEDSEWNVPGGKVFFATIAEPDHSKTEEARLKAKPFIVEALAVKSTGNLVDGDSARFCGILTGVVLAGSDLKLQHRAVGMFELPENTGASARAVPTALTPAPNASAAR